MINFFPIRYEDELLYSVISRYKETSGFINKKAVFSSMFNKQNYRVSVLFTQNIQTLVSNLPINCRLTTEQLINENTMYPFYTAFLNQERKNKVYYSMLNAKSEITENLLGIGQWKHIKTPYLKYCLTCFKEDMTIYGESYWRRLHQVPGVLVCEKHMEPLTVSNIFANEMQRELICPDYECCQENITYTGYDDRFIEHNVTYIENCKMLLNTVYESKSQEFIKNFYIDKLREMGLASSNGSIYMKDFQSEFIKFYGREYLKFMESDLDIDNSSNWLRLFIRSTNKNRSPLRHLLVLQFLVTEVSSMFESKKVVGKLESYKRYTPVLNKEERRESWLILLKDNPKASRSKLKKMSGGLYSWIFRHDREWFESVTPIYRTKPKQVSGIDYKMIDDELLIRAQSAVNSILTSNQKPMRVTIGSIKRVATITKCVNSGKYPKTEAFIRSSLEDTKSYSRRRVKWAIIDLQRENVILTRYKVQIRAGLGGSGISEKMKQFIEENIREYENKLE